jgi:3-hydroxyacyl-CoA dehydrogenase / enoyl-CoA hydratase / 3-hydroxybutyryl-CoA epimerase
MNNDSHALILCDQPPGNRFADILENELIRPGAEAVLIEFRRFPEGELKEIDQILEDDPSICRLREALRKMEQQTIPVVALAPESLGLLQFEIALACHARFANSREIRLNFPWNKYGLMPVLGGSQRLPRLVGIELASRILLHGETLTMAELASAGLFHSTGAELRKAAAEWAADNRGYKQPWDRDPNEMEPTYSQSPRNRLILEKIYLRLRQKVIPEEAAPTAILQCLQEGLERSFDAGLRLEAEAWSSVRASRSTKNRVQIYSITQPKARSRSVAKAIPFKRVGVLGAGLMGTGIACAAARSGCDVVLVDISQPALDRSVGRIQKMAERASAAGAIARDAPDNFLRLIHPSTSINAFAECEFIVEAIFERPDLKKAALCELSSVVDSRTVIASNTTTLPISDLAKAVENSERFLGTHFFAPADRMELIEIIVGETTSGETVDRALLLARMMYKTPVVVRDGPGFFTSRVVMAYVQEALLMLREGASPWLIDNVAQNAGMILGPLTVADLTSLDLLANIFESLAAYGRGMAREASDSLEILRQFTARSRLGRKTRAGIYDYDANYERADWSDLRHLFGASEYSPAEIEQRLFVSQAIEASHALYEGIIDDPAMADLASVLGWSYPAARGGVLSYIEFVGADTFHHSCQKLQRKFGDRFRLPLAQKKHAL